MEIEKIVGVAIEEGYQHINILADNGAGEFAVRMPFDQAVALAQGIASATAHVSGSIIDPKTGDTLTLNSMTLEAKSIGFMLSNDGRIGLSIQSAVGQIPPILLPDDVIEGLSKQLDARSASISGTTSRTAERKDAVAFLFIFIPQQATLTGGFFHA